MGVFVVLCLLVVVIIMTYVFFDFDNQFNFPRVGQ